MPEKWIDESITTRANRTPAQRAADAREAEAQRELAPMPACPNCGESRQDHLWPLGFEVRCDECGQRYKCKPMPSRAQRVAKLEARVNELHDLIEQQQTGARHLAGRFAKLEALMEQQHALINRQHSLINRLCAQAHRVREQFPSVAEPTIQQQCDAVEFRGPPEEDEG